MQAPAGLLEGSYASLVVGLLHAWLRPSGEPEGRRHTQEEAHLLRSSCRGLGPCRTYAADTHLELQCSSWLPKQWSGGRDSCLTFLENRAHDYSTTLL